MCFLRKKQPHIDQIIVYGAVPISSALTMKKSTEGASKTQRSEPWTYNRSQIRDPKPKPKPMPILWPHFYPLSPWARFSHIFIFFMFSCLFLFHLETFAQIKAQHLQQRSTSSHPHRSQQQHFILFSVFYFHTYFVFVLVEGYRKTSVSRPVTGNVPYNGVIRFIQIASYLMFQ